MDDPRIANGLNIRVHGFETRPEPKKDERGKETGEIIMRDWVKYGPPMMMDRQVVEARVDRILKATKPSNSNNTAANTAWDRAEYIRPLYEAWKKGEALPDTGTPLAALNFLRSEEVAVLKMAGVRTAEELAAMLDSNLGQIKLPAMREKRAQAKRFLEAQDTNKAAAKIAANEQEIAALKAQMAEILAARNVSQSAESFDDEPIEVDENGDRLPVKRGPGRPRKIHNEAEAA